MLGIEFPLLAFSHCRDVVVAVSKAGGMGVFGAAALPPERLEEELAWIDAHIGGRPYGVDLIVPNSFAGKGEAPASNAAKVPESHLRFAADLLGKFVGGDAYTYVYDAQLGYLDYAFASRALLEQVTGATAWHINADEPDILDYDLSFKPSAQRALFTADPFRSSDHDPVLVGLKLGGAANGR